MKNGFIYPLANSIIKFLHYCNIVEGIKFIAKLYSLISKPKGINEKDQLIRLKSHVNIAIDIYQVLKWAVLLFFWLCNFKGRVSLIITIYLICSNLFTYFYYHVWGSQYKQINDKYSKNRRFLNSLIAIAYYIFAYAYLFHIHYADLFLWPNEIIDSANAIYLSFANSFTLTYGDVKPLNQFARSLLISEIINTFIFITIIITNSIPNHIEEERQEEI